MPMTREEMLDHDPSLYEEEMELRHERAAAHRRACPQDYDDFCGVDEDYEAAVAEADRQYWLRRDREVV